MHMLVFVYGTLKRGQGNNRILLETDSEFVDVAVTGARWRMWTTGFPAIVREHTADPLGAPVRGEVWRVNAGGLRALDRLEGNGYMYRRELITVRTRNAVPFYAQGYTWLRDVDGLLPVKPGADGVLDWRGR